MGSIIRLNTTFNNAKLKTLQDYDTDTLKQQILSLPTLRAFYDATDKTTMTISGNLVTRLNDLSANQLHFVQTTTSNAPSYDEQAFGHVGGLVFGGNHWLTANDLFKSTSQGSIVAFIKGDQASNNIFFAPTTHKTFNFYLRANDILFVSGASSINETHIGLKAQQIIASYDTVRNTAQIISSATDAQSQRNNDPITRPPDSPAYLGRWSDGQEAGKFVGKIAHLMIFDEDLSKNQAVLDLVQEYAKRKYRI